MENFEAVMIAEGVEEASSKELSVIGPDGKPIKNQEIDAKFLALRFSKLAEFNRLNIGLKTFFKLARSQ